MKELESPILEIVMGAILLGMGVLVGIVWYDGYCAKTYRTEAVKRGYAEWVVSVEGRTTRQWKEVAK